MGRSTTSGYFRQKGKNGATPAVMLASVEVTFDPTQANTTGTGVFLPAGAAPTFAKVTNAGATGGTNPTVDVGLSGGNADALLAEADADTANAAILTTGTALDAALAANTEITAGVGASAATGGTVTARVFYYMVDDQTESN